MLRGKSVLLVEDEPLIGMDILMALEDAGAQVSGPLRSIKACMAEIDGHGTEAPWNVAILDYNLLDGSAETLITRLAEQTVPIILHTGNPESVQSEFLENVTEVVPKPSRTDDLLNAVKRGIG